MTRLALISDIHGNLVALEAILADIAARGVTEIVCLGDIAATGPQPHEVAERVRALGCPVVMGNTDAWLLTPAPRPDGDEAQRVLDAIDLWCAEQLTPEDRAFLASFQPTVSVPLDGGKRLLCYHGSPRSFNDRMTPDTPEEQVSEWLTGTDADLYAGGHTHVQMLRRYQRSILVNPGSVGLPLNPTFPGPDIRNPAWGEYALVECDGDRLSVALQRVPFDTAALVRIAHTSGMPHAEVWNADWDGV
ncbi:MAG TPA: metallophosphoesterase family protein [Ktedonobacterales bacterium]|nr:metallophosphoesterase family protein [Ktedonobacterales bacterium]